VKTINNTILHTGSLSGRTECTTKQWQFVIHFFFVSLKWLNENITAVKSIHRYTILTLDTSPTENQYLREKDVRIRGDFWKQKGSRRNKGGELVLYFVHQQHILLYCVHQKHTPLYCVHQQHKLLYCVHQSTHCHNVFTNTTHFYIVFINSTYCYIVFTNSTHFLCCLLTVTSSWELQHHIYIYITAI